MSGMNLLIVMADQMTPFALGCYGGQSITPNIDKLAAEGTRFDAAYSNSPLCTPGRYAFMTGQYISRIGGWDNACYLPSTVPTFAHYLRAMGYRTCLSGKMHFVGADQLHGFEERLTTDVYPADFGWVPDWTKPNERIDLWYHNMSSVVQSGVASITNQLEYDDEVGTTSMRWLYDAARGNDDRPFCLVSSFIHPHDPYAARQRYWDLYDEIDIAGPTVPRPEATANDPHSLRLEKVIALDAVDLSEEDIIRTRRAYYANCSYVDDWLGRIRAVLEETGQADNTAILFVVDHGDMLGERGLWYKMSFYEWSCRIPLIMSLPGESGGKIVGAPVSQVDVLPTLTALASDSGAGPIPEEIDPLDGTSLTETPSDDRMVAIEYCGEGSAAPMLMLRKGSLKYTTAPGDPEQLFNLADDPNEVNDRIGDDAYADSLTDFRDAARAHWNTDEVTAQVLDSQRRRRLVSAALRHGKYTGWDYQPKRDAENEYTRSHMELSDFDYRSRFPRAAEFNPRWK